MKEEIKVGDRVLVKKFFGGVFHAEVMTIKDGIFGKKYICRWIQHDVDFGIRSEVAGIISSRNILGKD